jgi:hypothetical protein
MDKFWTKVKKTDTCWLYEGATNRGYGWVYSRGKGVGAHRVAYTLAHGRIPAGLDIDHLCFERRCVNPRHLEAVTRGENTRRSNAYHAAHRTHCRNGHLRSEANSRRRRDGRGTVCRVCQRLYMRAYSRASRTR